MRRFAAQTGLAAAPAAPVPGPDPRDAELGRLAAEIARLERAREDDAAVCARAIEAARSEGRSQGLAEAEAREADRLAALAKALRESAETFAVRLEALDALAPALARAALGKLFSDVDGWSAPVEAMLARQLAGLRRAALVTIRVSPQDFSDPQALALLSDSLGIEGVALESDRALRAGASRIECRLGQIDLDVREQWQAVSALLEEMAR